MGGGGTLGLKYEPLTSFLKIPIFDLTLILTSIQNHDKSNGWEIKRAPVAPRRTDLTRHSFLRNSKKILKMFVVRLLGLIDTLIVTPRFFVSMSL
jgi:hypothetical protein